MAVRVTIGPENSNTCSEPGILIVRNKFQEIGPVEFRPIILQYTFRKNCATYSKMAATAVMFNFNLSLKNNNTLSSVIAGHTH